MTATFDELFSEHHEKVLLAAYRVTGNMQDAEDVLQSVFLRLLKRRDPQSYGVNAAAYLRRAATNAGIDLLRSPSTTPRPIVSLRRSTHPPGVQPTAKRVRLSYVIICEKRCFLWSNMLPRSLHYDFLRISVMPRSPSYSTHRPTLSRSPCTGPAHVYRKSLVNSKEKTDERSSIHYRHY